MPSPGEASVCLGAGRDATAAAERRDFKRPKDVLTDALRWLTNPKAYARQGAKGN